jgi:PAS domain S-box-containing protein
MPKRALNVITESERFEEALKRSYKFMAETAVEVVLTIDADDKILFVNPAVTKVAGYTPSELVGQKITRLIPDRPSRRKAGLRTASPASNNKKQFQTVAARSRGLILHKDGRKITADIAVEKFKIAGKPMAATIIRDSGPRANVTTRKAAEEKRSASESRYRNVVESQTDLICRYLPDTSLTFVNDAYCRYFRRTREELLGSKFLQFVPESLHEKILNNIRSLLDGSHGEGHLEHQVVEPDGEIGWMHWINCVTRSDGGVVELQGIGRDITENKRLQEDLSRREREFATLVENSPDIISRLDRSLRFTYVSPAAHSQFGIPAALFIGKSVREVGVHAKDLRSFESACKNVFTSRKPEYREFFYGEKYYRTRIIPEFTETGAVVSVMCIDQDITEQRRIEVELRTLSTRLLDMQDRERRRIARELHDGTAQNLFAMTIGLSRLLQQTIPPDLEGTLEECLALCEQSRQEIRTLSYVLHPPMLDEAGLVSALKWYTEGFSERSGIRVDLALEPDPGRLPLEIETVLFRVVQECLANVHRHSGSALASVRLQRKTESVILQVQDWGHGIPPEVGRAGVGIPGMRERLSQLLGHLEIESGGQGTTITVTVPLVAGRASGALYDSEKHKQSRIH